MRSRLTSYVTGGLLLALAAVPATAQETSTDALVAFPSGESVVVHEVAGPRSGRISFDEPVTFVKFSPDSSRLAVVSGSPAEQQSEVTLSVVVPGEPPRPVASVTGRRVIDDVDWSPDGTQLAYTRRSVEDSSRSVWIADADGGQPEQLTPNEGHVQVIGWRPIAGSRQLAVGPDLRLLHVDTGELSEHLGAQGSTGGWSPLGQHVATAGYPGFSWAQLDITDVRDGQRVTLLENAAGPAFSPDGRQIATWSVESLGTTHADLVVIELDSGQQRTLVEDAPVSRSRYQLDWSPDGQHLVYVNVEDSGPVELESVDVRDGTRRRVTTGGWLGLDVAPSFREAWLTDVTATARNIADACPAEVPEDGYEDVPNANPHEFAIDCVSWWGVANGTTATTYSPTSTVKRAQMASFLVRLIRASGGSLPTPSRDYFVDDNGNTHEPAINHLAEAGIVSGSGDGRYNPGRAVNRAQMATFLVNSTNWRSDPDLYSSHDYFSDDNGNAHEPAINAAAEAGLTGGTPDGGYDAAGDVRRDQMGSFLARVLDLLVERGDTSPPR